MNYWKMITPGLKNYFEGYIGGKSLRKPKK